MSIKGIAANHAGRGAESAAAGQKVKRSLIRTKYRSDQKWAFGFKFFKEMKNFGLDSDQITRTWLLSLMYRLKDLSALSLAAVIESHGENDTLRRHNIDWNAKSIPIQRDDIDWLEEYFDNPEEYPLFQLSVSKALGRIVGFLDEDNVFQVVLLDPLHNAQPSNYNGYKVRLSHPLGCEITSIRHKASSVSVKSKENGCECWQGIDEAFAWNRSTPGLALVMPMKDEKLLSDADDLIKDGHIETYAGVFEKGIEAVLEKSYNSAPAAALPISHNSQPPDAQS